MGATIWYLYHSGFALRTEGHFLIFDYWKMDPRGGGLAQGVINPAELADLDVIAFASHAHGDHYSPELLRLGEGIARYRVVLSDDIRPAPGALMVGPGQRLEQPDFVLETLDSTDEGVAFLLEIDGLRIYHAGDLNWWHWEGEPEPYNTGMKEKYQAQIAKLGGRPIDLAFVPVDPRLGEQYLLGIDHLMRTQGVRCVVPMHFGDDVSVVDRLLRDPQSAPYRDRVLALTARGQSATI
ncbi:MAG: MBL fold metallo-hydrolase [Clostridiales bacterium]|nr:MBL fold metallo-hydrolase [Clostridiales bacterium]